jgi:ABC-type molybdenum transport system ATPase subunit/photorepair protein PhrA
MLFPKPTAESRYLIAQTLFNMIEVQNINYSINKRQLLSQVSFDFPSGKLLAIMGANGAGKSTLLKVLSKELPYQEGKVRLAHRNLNTYRSDELAQIRAVLAQQNTLAFEFKVDDLVMMGRYPHFTSTQRPRPSYCGILFKPNRYRPSCQSYCTYFIGRRATTCVFGKSHGAVARLRITI